MPALARPRALALRDEARRGLIWAGAIVIAVCAGFTSYGRLYQTLVVALLVTAGLLTAAFIQLRHGLLGLAVLVLTAVAFPVEPERSGRAPLNSSLPLATAVVVMWLVRRLIVRERNSPIPSRALPATYAFVGVSALAFAAAQLSSGASRNAPLGAQLAGLALLAVSGGLLLAVADGVRDLNDLRLVTWVFILAGAVTAVSQTFPGLGFVGRWVAPDSVGSLFWTWMAAVCFSQAVCNRCLAPPARFVVLGLAAVTIFRGFFLARSWASGWIPPLVACGAILAFRFPRTAISVAMFAIPVGLMLGGHFVTAEQNTEQYSAMTRLEASKVLWPLVQDNPLLGLGPSNYYYRTAAVPILGWYVNFNSHNQYMDLLAQVGFLGLLAFVWFVFEISTTAVSALRHVAEGFPKAYVVGVIGGIAGTAVSGMLADWIVPFYYNIGIRGFRSSLLFWVFCGGLLALTRILRNEEASGQPDPDDQCASYF